MMIETRKTHAILIESPEVIQGLNYSLSFIQIQALSRCTKNGAAARSETISVQVGEA